MLPESSHGPSTQTDRGGGFPSVGARVRRTLVTCYTWLVGHLNPAGGSLPARFQSAVKRRERRPAWAARPGAPDTRVPRGVGGTGHPRPPVSFSRTVAVLPQVVLRGDKGLLR